MSDATAAGPFRPYTEMPSLVPGWVWTVARILALATTAAVLIMLVVDPELGITLFWRIFIPSLPLVFALVPGIWRQVCPMAFLNQLPVRMGLSAGKTLPMWLKESSYLFAMIAFVGFVTLKHVTFYDSAIPLLFLALGALAAAFVGGLIFKGRSGWCGTFCPLGPLQKVYGHAPAVLVKNGYCETGCVGCQKNCYDFSPRSAFFADLSDKDSWYAGHRRMFIGLLPGLILSFWLGRSPEVIGYGAYLQETALWLIVSAGSFFIFTSVLRNSVYKVAAFYGVFALFLYYWFAAPVILGGIRDIFDIRLPDIIAYLLQAVVVIVAARNLYAGLRLEQAYEAQVAGASGFSFAAPAAGGAADTPGAKRGAGGRAVLIERSSGKQMPLDPAKTILELMEDADLNIDFGCRSGMCGADPIYIEDGAENLTPPSKTELETLRRLGLEGKARMACVCKVRKGSVTIDLAADLAAASEVGISAPTQDLAELAGVSRIVIVGNGVAGITAADRLRQASPSVEIDVVSRENHHFYNRMAIGRAIYGRTALDGLDLLPNDWAKKNDIRVWLNTFVTGIDRDARAVQLGTGETLPYDKLVLATGGKPVVPDLPGIKLDGCFVLRKARDALKIRTYAQRQGARNAVVVGGGVLGIEAADALRQLGLHVTLLQRSDRLMDRNLDEKASGVLARRLRDLGMDVRLNAEIARVDGDALMDGVTLADGQRIDAQICLFCIGVSGQTELAEAAGLDTGRGIRVDHAMRTSDPDIYAVGDAAEFGSGPSGLWTLGAQHAQLATDDILHRREGSSVPHTVMKLKMDDVDVVAYGEPELKKLGQEEIIAPDESDDLRRRLLIENGRVVGAFIAGPPGSAKGVADVILEEQDISALLPELRRGNWDVLANGLAGDAAGAGPEIGPAPDIDPVQDRANRRSALSWAAGILIGIGIASVGAMLLGAAPDKMKMDQVMSMIDDAMTPKRKSEDATTRFAAERANGREDAADDAATDASSSAATPAVGTQPDEQTRETTTKTPASAASEEVSTADRPAPPRVEDGNTSLATQDSGQDPKNSASDPSRSAASEGTTGDPTAETAAAPAAGDDGTPGVENGPVPDLQAALSGKTLRGGRDFGGRRFTIRLAPNGSLSARIALDETFGSEGVDSGQWSVDGDRLCLRLNYLADGRRTCAQVRAVEGALTFTGTNGAPRGWRVE